jgi:hypothetical protein
MKKEIKSIIEEVKKAIVTDLCANDNETFKLVLNAYNRYQEDERDGVDYFFNLTDKDDLIYMIECGLTIKELHYVFVRMTTENFTPYVHFGQNYTGVCFVGTESDTKRQLIACLDEILEYTFMYVTRCTEYQDIYERYVTMYL